jgi:hypothetical protein
LALFVNRVVEVGAPGIASLTECMAEIPEYTTEALVRVVGQRHQWHAGRQVLADVMNEVGQVLGRSPIHPKRDLLRIALTIGRTTIDPVPPDYRQRGRSGSFTR